MPIEISIYPLDVIIAAEGAVLFGSTQDKKRVAVLDATYLPYFLLPTENVQRLLDWSKKNNLTIEHAQEEGEFTKVFTKLQDFEQTVKLARKITRELYNADIPLARRYWLERKINPVAICKVRGEMQVQNKYRTDIFILAEHLESADALTLPRVIAFDIETASSGPYPDPSRDAIVSLAFYGEDFKRVITWKRFSPPDTYQVEFVDSESALIESFVRILKDTQPQLLVGYGSDNFDFPYLLARAKKYNLAIDLGWAEAEQGRRQHFVGLPCADIAYFIRMILDLDTDHYNLDIVAKKMLGKGKLGTLGAKKINEIWSVGLNEELRFLADYNLTDAQLTFELAKKILLVQAELCKLTGLPIQHLNYTTYGALVEWFIIKNAGIPIPMRPRSAESFARRRRGYTGGFVVEPKPGLYKNIRSFDFRSLYPSIIASHNISPDTLNCSCCQFRGGFRADNQNLWFCSKKQGFVPMLVKELIERRKRINEILKQTPATDAAFTDLLARQHALKYIAASIYGYLGFPDSRFYSYECASAITALGRKYIEMVIGEAEKLGFKTLYGDTDSLFVEASGKVENIEKFLQIINSVLPSPMELEFRAKYLSGLFLERKSGLGGAKKRYALLTEGQNLILRGLEAIRGDWSALAKRSQREILQIILAENDVDKALAHLQDLAQKVRSRAVKIEDLAIRIKLTRPLEQYKVQTPHVAAAKLAKDKGYPVQKGFVVSYIVVAGGDKVSSRVKLAEDCTAEDYDIEYYINQQLLRANYKIFELFGHSLEKLKAGQTTLGDL